MEMMRLDEADEILELLNVLYAARSDYNSDSFSYGLYHDSGTALFRIKRMCEAAKTRRGIEKIRAVGADG